MNDLALTVLVSSAVVTTLFFWRKEYSLTISLIAGLALALLFYPILSELGPLNTLLHNTWSNLGIALGKVIFLFCSVWFFLVTVIGKD